MAAGPGASVLTGATATEAAVASGRQPNHAASIDPTSVRVLMHLAVAVQRHRIYPPLSPLCKEAVSECAKALAALHTRSATDGPAPDVHPAVQIAQTVAPAGDETVAPAGHETAAPAVDESDLVPELQVKVGTTLLYVDLVPVPSSTAIDELADRLFRADVEELSFRANTGPTEIARFCRRLASWDRGRGNYDFFSEAIAELGITGIGVRCTERLDVLDFDVLPSGQLESLRVEQSHRDSRRDDLEVSLQKAWVRVDTDCPLDPIDMLDLAFLVDSQADLAQMLLGMARGEGPSVGAPVALRQTVSELVHLYSGLSESVAEERFATLAATLMELEPEARRTLTRDVLLPDLLQSGKAAAVLRMLPDGEIVEAIRTLVDLDVGGAGLVGLALERLELSGERLGTMTRSMSDSLRLAPQPGSALGAPGVASQPTSQIRLESDHTVLRDMRQLAAHDLGVDAETAKQLRAVRDGVSAIDEAAERLRCVLLLLPHIRNPDRATEVLASVTDLLRPLLWEKPLIAAERIAQLLDIANRLDGLDPEVGAAIKHVVGDLLDANYIQFQAERWRDAGKSDETVTQLLTALGPTATAAFHDVLEEASDRQIRRTILTFMCAHAEVFAESLYDHLADARWTVVRNSVRVLGFAAPGGEAAVAKLLGHSEKRVIREAFLALSRIGTPRAAEEILGQLEASDPRRREMAEDAIRRFPVAEGEKLTGRLLSKPEFYQDRPQVARALIERFMNPPSREGADLLRPLLGLRLWFWKPALCRLGWAASAALSGGGK